MKGNIFLHILLFIILGIMPHCITSDTLKRPLETITFDGKNYENEMKGDKFAKVQTFSA